MLFRLPCSAQKECAISVLFLRSAALITVLTWFLLFNGCGASGPVTNPTNTSTPNLTISTTLPAASVGSNYSATVTVTGGTALTVFLSRRVNCRKVLSSVTLPDPFPGLPPHVDLPPFPSPFQLP